MDKIDKLWELMQDVDSLEDIYETEDDNIAFVFESEGDVDKRVEQIMKGLDKEGYMNSFEETNGSNVIVFDIDFEDELEEGIDYKPKFIPDTSVEELQDELNQMYADQYKYGRSIDRPRMWDINYTIKQLKKGLKEEVKFEPEYIPRDWKDVYNLFEILGNEEDIRYLCKKHKGEKAWDTACEKWFEDDELEEDLENSEGKEIPSAPTEDNTGIANLVNALIKDEWDAIDGYQSAIATLRSLSGNNEDAILVFQEIANDEYSHIGNLQKILDKFAPQVSTIADGAEEAEETIANNSK